MVLLELNESQILAFSMLLLLSKNGGAQPKLFIFFEGLCITHNWFNHIFSGSDCAHFTETSHHSSFIQNHSKINIFKSILLF